MRVEKYTIERDKDGQIYSERRTMQVDIGFWNKKGEYIEQKEELTMEEEIIALEEENKRLLELAKEERQLREGWHAQCEVIEALRKRNEELKNNIELMSKYNSENFDEVIKLRQENEELKKEKEIYKENVHYLACMTSQRNKLKLALEEIREINKKWLSRWLNDTDERYGFEEIESKINEVLRGGVEQ